MLVCICVDEERIKSDLDPHVDQEPHQMFGQEHVVKCANSNLQVADQTANGSLEGLLDWVKVCVTNKSEVELHMLDRILMPAFDVFLDHRFIVCLPIWLDFSLITLPFQGC